MKIFIPHATDGTEAELTETQFAHVERIIVSMMNGDIKLKAARQQIEDKLNEVNDPLVFLPSTRTNKEK